MTFDTLSLHPKILKAVAESGYSKPTQIQLKAIPKVMKGFDIRASAQTGTGKTAAFLLPALNRLTAPSPKGSKGPRAVILVPTRELAMQIEEQTRKYSKYLKRINTVCIVGGVPYPPQMRKLSRPYDVLIATPGRLIDFIDRGKINFSRLEFFVLDEADRMLDMGFVEPVEQIVAKMPPSRQTLLFSATLQGSVIKLSERLLTKPMEIVVRPKPEKKAQIKQTLHYVDDMNHKNRLLDHVLRDESIEFAIVFTSTKRHADQIVKDLRDQNFKAAALHGDMNQRKRSRTIEQLKSGKFNILVATDVAARGIDVQSITHVINYDLPGNAEDYVHRIGRTGRAGASGTALSFVAGRDRSMVKKIEDFTGNKIDILEIPGFEARQKKQAPSNTKRRPSRRFKGNGKGKKPSNKMAASRRKGFQKRKRKG